MGLHVSSFGRQHRADRRLYMLPTIAGSLGFLLAPKNAYVARLICFYLTGSYQTSFVINLSIITSNTAGQTKKMLTSGLWHNLSANYTDALIWFGSCVGSIASPFFYKASQAPTYPLGIASMLATNILELLCFVWLRWYLIRQNKKKDAVRAQAESGVPHVNATTFSDLTDKQNPKWVVPRVWRGIPNAARRADALSFRYVY